jgi:hypothetical protein
MDVTEIRRALEHAREAVLCNALFSTEAPLTVDLALDEVDRAILCLVRLEEILLAHPALRGRA